jgi:hypothetical protein
VLFQHTGALISNKITKRRKKGIVQNLRQISNYDSFTSLQDLRVGSSKRDGGPTNTSSSETSKAPSMLSLLDGSRKSSRAPPGGAQGLISSRSRPAAQSHPPLSISTTTSVPTLAPLTSGDSDTQSTQATQYSYDGGNKGDAISKSNSPQAPSLSLSDSKERYAQKQESEGRPQNRDQDDSHSGNNLSPVASLRRSLGGGDSVSPLSKLKRLATKKSSS